MRKTRQMNLAHVTPVPALCSSKLWPPSPVGAQSELGCMAGLASALCPSRAKPSWLQPRLLVAVRSLAWFVSMEERGVLSVRARVGVTGSCTPAVPALLGRSGGEANLPSVRRVSVAPAGGCRHAFVLAERIQQDLRWAL